LRAKVFTNAVSSHPCDESSDVLAEAVGDLDRAVAGTLLQLVVTVEAN
jgi:hypothetical protein